jgi:sugar phosphate isomerase/epimerase
VLTGVIAPDSAPRAACYVGGVSIAAQAYTIRERMAADVPEALRRLREVGYERVELAGLHGLSAARMRECLDDAGLTAVAAHEPWSRVSEDGGLVEDARALGMVEVVVPSMPAPWRDGGAAGYREFGKLLGERAAALAGEGLRLHYHNHGFELERRDGFEPGLAVLAAAAGPDVGLELDLAWLRGAGEDPAAYVAGAPAGRVRLVHVKDVLVDRERPLDTEVGAGVIEWEPVVAACRAAGVEHYIVEQDTPGPDPFRSLAASLAKVRALGVR